MFIAKQHHPHCRSIDIPVIDFFLFLFPRLLIYYGMCMSVTIPSATTDMCLSAFCLPLFFLSFSSNFLETVGVLSVVAL